MRRPGGGRKRAADLDPGLLPALLALVEPQERGDPMSPLRWTTLSTRNLAAELARQGHKVSARTVGDLLRREGFSLQGNAKTVEGKQHADRDAQFSYIGEQAREYLAAGDPVVSVDAKKKELVGEFKNGGREWRPKGSPARVDAHDFPSPKIEPNVGARQLPAAVCAVGGSFVRAGCCGVGKGQAAWVSPGPAGSGSGAGVRQRVTSRPWASISRTW